ncbi:hypothetical protein [Larsenimonas salina]|uniref:hypothetical protein n=1 Tax=Larsenimonas salina TaxID=1295565 RepID=UPI0020735385|nr:hypothetical protein [Larsenimonas salina]MCM5705695.1 hypothetical protein [Larsenimonas salina]
MNIHYRPATTDDFDAIVELFLDTMNLSLFTSVTDREALRHMAILFLAKDLHNANHIDIAECEGELCGVLMGTTRKAVKKALRFDPDPWLEAADAALSCTPEGQNVLDDLEQSLEALPPKSRAVSDCDSELVFFSTRPRYRRRRVGSTLIRQFEAFLYARGACKYYLYSDSLCTYQFYDANGFERVERMQNTFNPDIENYTYVKPVPENA